MLANDMNKGQLGTTTDGIKFRIEDNKKGMIRFATVYGSTVGLFDEMGSIYIHELATVDLPDGRREPVEFSTKQQIQIGYMKAAGF